MYFSKSVTVAKLFFLLSFTGLIMYVVLAFYTFHTAYVSLAQSRSVQNNKIYHEPELDTVESGFDMNLKYILLLAKNSGHRQYDVLLKEGQYHFVKQNCSHQNCYWTTNKHLLNKDMRNFDAVVIDMTKTPITRLPEFRTVKQKYIFYGMEPANHKLTCREDIDSYFNLTWTYKLNSDILSPFFIVKDMNGNVVAPRPDVEWSKGLTTTYLSGNDTLKFKRKTKAVAAIVKNCNNKDGEIYAKRIRTALKFYSLTLDIYGCDIKCPNNTEEGCDSIIENDYYFVLVQEKILTEDYLTDKVLKAYLNNAVPIIRTGADPTKFLPTGSYINALHSDPDTVAALIHYSINDISVYHSYFRWIKFYTFHRSDGITGACELCALLNDEKSVTNLKSYETLRKWWYTGPVDEKFCSNTTGNLE